VNVRSGLSVSGVIVIVSWLAAVVAAQGQQQQGPLGVVNALGQEFRLPPAPTGPPPRLPDGTIDLGDGIWVNVKPYTVAVPAEGASMDSCRHRDGCCNGHCRFLSRFGLSAWALVG
jgi:hypothetical protein